MVLMDVMMPEMDGFEVTRRIRAHPELGNLPIIMVTGLTRMEDRLDALQAGANDFVSKPIDRVELAVRVASHLKLKEARDKGRASDARYRILVENSPLGTLCCNLGGEVTEMNAAASDLFGIPRGESWRLGNLLKNPNLTSPEAADFLMGCIESGKPAVGEFDIGPQGEKCIRFHVVPLYDEERGVSGLQIVCEDNSDRKRAEELQRRRTRLKAFAEMARGSVRHFSDGLEKIGEDVVRGLRSLDSRDYDAVRHSLESIRDATGRSSQTVILLDKFSRGYSKRDTPEWSSFDFSDAVREAIEITKPYWKSDYGGGSGEIYLQCELAQGCFVEGERTDMIEVAAHLIRNAVESMPSGGKLKVRTFCQGEHVLLEVQDNGTGMTKAQIDQIGYPFATSKRAHVGLGLAVSLGIVRRHFGTFWIASKKGRGTLFTIKFPLAATRRDQAEDTTLDIMASHPKTLLVDPDNQVSTRFAAAFQGKGAFYVARSIDEAVEIVHDKNIDAIVCSDVLDHAKITELSKRVSVFCTGKGTVRPPFIMLSGDGQSLAADASLVEMNIDRVVPKSIEITELMQIISHEIRVAGSRSRIAGTLGQIDILDVVQMMLLSGQQLVLEIISHEGKRCLLHISKGTIIHAKCEDVEGEEALHQALGLKSGSFSTLGWVEPERLTISRPGQAMLMEAARRRDEAGGPADDDTY